MAGTACITVGLIAVEPAGASTVFTPSADSYVSSGAPTRNYGTRTYVKVDASPTVVAYLRFEVAGAGPEATARLRLFANSSNSKGFSVHLASSSAWSESSLVWSNAPGYGPAVASTGRVSSGRWYDLNVSSIVTGDGIYTLALTSTSSTSTSIASRESSNPPQLLVPAPTPPSAFVVSREANTYTASAPSTGHTFVGSLKSVVESAVAMLDDNGGGTVTFGAGEFDLGSDYFLIRDTNNITFAGQGMDVTTIRNNSSAAADTEPFNMGRAHATVIRDLTVHADGSLRSTSDAIDFDASNDVVIERVKVGASRARGIVFDGKDMHDGVQQTSDRNLVRDCVIEGEVPSHGIELLAARDTRIEGCRIVGVAGRGIKIAKSSSVADQPNKQATGNSVVGNFIDDSGEDGILVVSSGFNVIEGNTVLNSSDDVTSRDGIRFSSSDSVECNDNVVSNNLATDNQATKTQRYGLHISSSSCHRTRVSGNDFSGNKSASIRDVASDTVYL